MCGRANPSWGWHRSNPNRRFWRAGAGLCHPRGRISLYVDPALADQCLRSGVAAIRVTLAQAEALKPGVDSAILPIEAAGPMDDRAEGSNVPVDSCYRSNDCVRLLAGDVV